MTTIQVLVTHVASTCLTFNNEKNSKSVYLFQVRMAHNQESKKEPQNHIITSYDLDTITWMAGQETLSFFGQTQYGEL